MLVDLRIYTYHSGKFKKFLEGYEGLGFALTSRHLGTTLGVFRSDDGVMNRTLQFFMYKDAVHREQCRQGMLADPEWANFIALDADALVQQTSVILTPTQFSPLTTDTHPDESPAPDLRIFELHSWQLLAPRFDEALTLLGDGGASRLMRHAGTTIAWLGAVTGDRHRLVCLSAYTDWAEWGRARALAADDPEVRTTWRDLNQYVAAADCQIIRPLPYSPLR